jgi:hypothetical protein
MMGLAKIFRTSAAATYYLLGLRLGRPKQGTSDAEFHNFEPEKAFPSGP